MQTRTKGSRLLALVLAVLMVFSLLPTAVFAEETTPDYELRVLTFEDADYKGGTNFAGKADWSSLIDDPQYGGTMLYPDGSGTTDVSKAYTWTDANNTELTHTLPKSWDNYCYWGGGHAVSNYVSGEFITYGDFNNQLTVYQKGTTGLKRTGGGHNGSNNFAVHFGYKDNSGYTNGQILPSFSFANGEAHVIDHMYVNNICYAVNCYLNGNDLTAKIDDTDWVKLTATGYGANGAKTGEASIYLCNGPKDIILDWTKFDLSGLGKVAKVEFNITGSSDNGHGFSQPAYFAYDDVAVRFEKEAPAAPPVTVTTGGTELPLTRFEGGSDSFADEYYTLSAPYGSSLTVCMPDATDIITYDIHGDDFFNGMEENSVTLTAEQLNTLLIDAGNLEALHATAFQPQAGSKAAFLSVIDSGIGKKYGLLIELTSVPATGVMLDKTELSLNTGETATLTATVEPDNAADKTVTWTTSAEDVATVENGIVTALKVGTATITATCGEAKAECAVTVTASAEPAKDENGVYQIGTADELRWFADKVNSGEYDLNAKLTADIDLENKPWTPIGNNPWIYLLSANDRPGEFTGTFDGDGHVVKNLYINIDNADDNTGNKQGLFGLVTGKAVIKNLGVTGSVTTTGKRAGGIAGYLWGSPAKIENCFSAVDVTAHSYAGGIAGGGQSTSTVKITNCYNTGDITVTLGFAGGIAVCGTTWANNGPYVSNCYNTGKITKVGGASGNDRLGAILCVSSKNKPAAYGSSLFYLEGCVEGVASVGADKTTAKTAEEMKNIAPELSDAFKTNTGCGSYPLLAWQAIVDHNYVDGKCTVCGERDPAAPYLLEGVTDTAATVQTGKSYQLDDLMDGKIFGVAEGDLTYANYFYTLSSDGGATWGEEQHFEQSLFGGVNKSLIQSVAGTYIYKFRAKNDAGYSADTWTLTLTFSDVVEENVNFYISRDQNYDTNGNKYPILKLYKTAGIDENQFDYVGWFTNGDGKTVYVYNPADYTIIDGKTDYVEIDGVQYELHDYEKIEFTNSAFDASDETATASNTVVDNYNMFYATLSTGRYSTRGYGWNTETEAYDIYLGGQSLPLPMEKDIYGGGGNDIYLGVISVYATTKNEKNEYFGVDDYHVEVIMPITGSMIHSGTPYTYTRYSSNYTAFPFLSYEADNASLYNIYAYPANTEKYMFNQKINNNTKHTYYVVTQSISIANAVELDITAPTSAEFTLFFQYNNFNTKPVEPYKAAQDEATGMTTYSYRISERNSNYTWRLADKNKVYVTKAGWLPSLSAKTEKTITFASDAPTDTKSHDFSKLGTQVINRDEADLQVFLSHSGFKSVSDTYRVRAFRMWELINSDVGNIMAEPKFNVQVLQGNDADIKQVNGGNAEGNWIDVKPTGTDIVAVTYDAIDMYSTADAAGTHAGLFPANNPERTGVFVITNEAAGTADATVVFNGGTASSRGADWDYNYDTWYYLNTDETPTLDFTVKAAEGVKVSYAVVTTDSSLKSALSDWSDLTAGADGTYEASLLPFRTAGTLGGTVIIKMLDSTGTSYRLVRVAQMSVTVKNASNGSEPIMPGDKVTLSFDGLYRGVDKVSGIFNPLQLNLNYSAGEDEFKGSLGQYQQMDKTTVTVTLPTNITFPEGADKTTYTITGGYISGGMYSAASPFDTLYNMTDTGVGTNFSAVSISFVASRLADIPVEVNTKVYYNVDLVPVDENGNAIDGLTSTLTDRDNKAVTAEEGGTFKLGYGPYTYAVEQLGYVRTSGSFTLGSADAAKIENGVLTIKFTVRKAAENAWDGKTTTEPQTDDDGVYLIGTGAELAWFAQKVNSGSTKISGILTADIDLAGYEWTPIGSISKNFAGTFDGKDHTVDNLFINYSSTTTASLYRGLFGWVSGANATNRAKIENLTVNGTVVAGSNKSVNDAYVGGIVGRADYADLTNLHSNVDVSIKRTTGNYWQSVGGVVGGTYYSLNVTNCSNSGNITGWRYCAGIVGNISSGNQPCTITGCVNTGNVTAPSTCAAGIVSNLPSNCKVTACYNTGTIKAGGNYAAGIVGYASKSEVANCFNLGEVICNESFVYGSVIGTVSDANAVIKNLYYLEGTCVKGGIGSSKGEQTATAKTAEEIANAEFVTVMNVDLAAAAFTTGCTDTNHPILLWQFYTEHSFTQKIASDELAKEVTCLEPAYYYVKCSNCDTVNTDLTVAVGEALGHDFTSTVVPATCEKDGYTEYTCERCGYVDRDDFVTAKGHDYTVVVTPATCTEVGYTTHTCSVCGDSYVDAIVKATGHNYTSVATPATCTEAGYTTHTCSVCGSSYVDSIVKAKGHTYTAQITTAPTCTAEGVKTFTCADCGDTYTESVAKLAHSYEATVTPATCTEAGYTTHTCSVCGNSYVDSIVKAVGHDYESNVVAATCDTMGYTEYTCKRCGDSYRTAYTPAKEHNYTAQITTEPTCTAEGVKTFTCTDCGKSYTEPVAKLAHSYKATVTAPTCTAMGYTTYVCEHCGDSYRADFVDAAGHDCEQTVTPATCLTYGYTTNVCKHCDYSFISAIINPLGHTEVIDAAVEPTCTETGLTEGKHCSACGEVLVAQEEIPAKGHAYEKGVCAVCGEKDPDYATWINPFKDVKEGNWFYEGVKFANQNGLFNGTSADLFSPNDPMTRAMLVTVLWRLDGKTAPKAAATYSDIDAKAYYADAVAWASENGVVNGVGNNKFDPEGKVTREQIAAILFRYTEMKGADTSKRADLNAFPDANKVSSYAKDAMAWANAEGLITGSKEGSLTLLDPQGSATRAQVAVILMRYAEK